MITRVQIRAEKEFDNTLDVEDPNGSLRDALRTPTVGFGLVLICAT